MQLYYMKTMNPRKVCAVAKHLQLEVEYVPIRFGPAGLASAEYLVLNPNAKVPTLVDGDITLWESAAIAAYMARKAHSDMWPEAPYAQADVLRWVSWDACHWMRALGNFYFELIIKPKLKLGEPDRSLLASSLPNVHRYAGTLDAHLAQRKHLAWDRLTIADFCVGAMLPEWERMELPLQEYPHLLRWHNDLMALDAWRDPWPAKAP